MAEESRYGTARAEWSLSAALTAGVNARRHLYADGDVAMKDSSGERPVMRISEPVAPGLSQRIARKVAVRAFRAVRPAVKSIAWRTRTFLAHDITVLATRMDQSARHSENLARDQHAQVVTLLRQVEAQSLSTAAEYKRSLRYLTSAADQQARRISSLNDEVSALKRMLDERGGTDV